MGKRKNKECTTEEARVEVRVDVAKIVKYCCATAIVIVGIIFGTKTWLDYLGLEQKEL